VRHEDYARVKRTVTMPPFPDAADRWTDGGYAGNAADFTGPYHP